MRRVWASAGAVGVGLIAGGTVLAAYSRFFASTWAMDEIWVDGTGPFRSAPEIDVSGAPDLFSTAALLIGVLMLGAVALMVARGRDSYGLAAFYLVPTVAAGLLYFPVQAYNYRVLTAYDRIRLAYPLFERLPTAIAAGTLVLLGTVSTTTLLRKPALLAELSRRTTALLCAGGLLISAAIAAVAISAGDDGRHVDHVMAAAVEPTAAPARLGTQRYRLQIPKIYHPTDDRAQGQLVAAGTGFVISSTEGVTAYDGASGTPRWHYLRTEIERDGDYGVTFTPGTLRSLDGGKVVLGKWRGLGWVAFDAATGEILWHNSDFARDESELGKRWNASDTYFGASPGPLALVHEDRLTGYDPRTGKRLWSTDPTPLDCKWTPSSLAGTDTAIYQIVKCFDSTQSWEVATAVDPRTGAVIDSRELARVPKSDSDDILSILDRLANSVSIMWMTGNDRNYLVVSAPEQLSTAPVTGTRGPEPMAADAAGHDVLVRTRQPYPADDTFDVRTLNADTGRYSLPGMRGYDISGEIFLADEVVERALYEYPGAGLDLRSEIRTWSRDDGHPVTIVSVDRGTENCSGSWLLAVPGAVLTACTPGTDKDRTPTEIIGFVTTP